MKIGGSELRRACTERQRGGDAASVSNSAGSNHWHANRINDLGKQSEQAKRFGRIGAKETPGVTARLETLRNDCVDSPAFQPARFLDARCIADDGGARRLDPVERYGLR